MRDQHEEGMRVRRAVLGDAHVDRAEAQKTDFDAPFQDFITRSAWGMLWTRSGLTQRERSLVTIGLLAALGNDGELALHLRATHNTGATHEEVREALMHVAVYAGVPRANHAMKIAKEIFAAMDAEQGGTA
jgi:4-carboxymuconolactone decarboxylase